MLAFFPETPSLPLGWGFDPNPFLRSKSRAPVQTDFRELRRALTTLQAPSLLPSVLLGFETVAACSWGAQTAAACFLATRTVAEQQQVRIKGRHHHTPCCEPSSQLCSSPHLRPPQGLYWLMPSAYVPGKESPYILRVFCTCPFNIVQQVWVLGLGVRGASGVMAFPCPFTCGRSHSPFSPWLPEGGQMPPPFSRFSRQSIQT